VAGSRTGDPPTYPIFRAKGSHRELGRQHGEQAAEYIKKHLDVMCAGQKMTRDALRQRALRFQPMRTLWGSLSGDGRMNLDLSLMLAPPEALEYVVVHEMAHLWVRNHGPRFWARVAVVDPDFEQQRDWLNRYGHGIKHELSRWIGEDID